MSNWASKFSSKEQNQRSMLERELLAVNDKLSRMRKEVLEGAPTRDHRGVMELKSAMRNAERQQRHLEKKLGIES